MKNRLNLGGTGPAGDDNPIDPQSPDFSPGTDLYAFGGPPETKIVMSRHIAIRGKPLCQCRFSAEQFVKLANAIKGQWDCSYPDEARI
jgi:hypothetical protein